MRVEIMRADRGNPHPSFVFNGEYYLRADGLAPGGIFLGCFAPTRGDAERFAQAAGYEIMKGGV